MSISRRHVFVFIMFVLLIQPFRAYAVQTALDEYVEKRIHPIPGTCIRLSRITDSAGEDRRWVPSTPCR